MREQREFMVHTDDVRAIWEPATLRVIRGPRWLRKPAQWALDALVRKFGAEVARDVRVRTFTVAKGETLLDKMRLQQRDMLRLYNREARYAFVGPDVLTDLKREMHAMSFGWQRFEMIGDRGMQVCGVELVYVPWMDGVLLVPEWKEPSRPPR